MTSAISLRILIPAIVLGSGVVIAGASYFITAWQTERQIEDFALSRIVETGRHFANDVAAALRRADSLDARAILIRAASDRNVRRAVLLDENDRIRYSTVFRQVGQPATETPFKQIAHLFDDARRRFTPMTFVPPDRSGIFLVSPIYLEASNLGLIPTRVGLLLAEYHFDPWRRQAKINALQQGIVIVALMAVLCVVIALAMQHFITRRVNRLGAMTGRIAAGEYENLQGVERKDELGELSNAIAKMAGTIKSTVAELRESEQRIRAIMESAVDGVLVLRPDGIIESANNAAARMFGFAADELIEKKIDALIAPETLDSIDDSDKVRREFSLSESVGADPQIMLGRRKDGSSFALELAVGEADLDRERRYVAVTRDITERRVLEDQLRQAQKMEAVGQLTGGISHDFNNLLGVIVGNLELLEANLSKGDKVNAAYAEQAMDAAEMGANLTQRLLAFSRKQTLQPKPTDLNAMIGDLTDLLRRTLGETIEIETVPASGLWLCDVDPSQMENAMLNLAINARDAMPDGGKLKIETANMQVVGGGTAFDDDLAPGQFVVLGFSDTGSGMSRGVMARAFEPFFSTKKLGEGSGLGLSMIYGFVKQSDGHVKIDSEPGRGTTVRIYLPRLSAAIHENEAPKPAMAEPAGGGETILVVEDNPELRAVVIKMLGQLGYNTMEANDAPAALELVERAPNISLLFTDVILPGGMSGVDLAQQTERIRPGLKVIYTSGYTENEVVHRADAGTGIELIHKPVRKAGLASILRRGLDS